MRLYTYVNYSLVAYLENRCYDKIITIRIFNIINQSSQANLQTTHIGKIGKNESLILNLSIRISKNLV